jgi:hypothetical protein
MDNFSFNPEQGFLDEDSYPSPSSGTESRTQLMSLHTQIKDFINNTIVTGINALIETVNGKQNALTFDTAPTADSSNPVTSGGVYTALGTKQNTLTFDNTPTSGSSNPVKSGGVYSAINDLHTSFTTDQLKLVSNGTTYIISVDGQGNLIATPEA